jgi:hypothetical protein
MWNTPDDDRVLRAGEWALGRAELGGPAEPDPTHDSSTNVPVRRFWKLKAGR